MLASGGVYLFPFQGARDCFGLVVTSGVGGF